MFFVGDLIIGGWGFWGGSETIISDQLKSHLFPAGILAKAINMAHCDILYQLDISLSIYIYNIYIYILYIYMFYFYESLLFQISIPWKFIKTWASSCLLSLLQSTATQITISINVFICFKYAVWNQFLNIACVF